MKKIINLTIRNIKVYFSDKGMFFTSLITPAILLVLYATFLANVYKDAFISALPEGIEISKKLLNGLVSGQLVGSLLSVSCITVAFCSNMLMVQDKVTGNIKDLIITPTDKKILAMSYFLASFISTLIVNLFALIICLIYIANNGWFMNITDILLILLNVIMLTLFGCILSSLINSFLSTQGQISAVGSIVSSMYGFIAGAYMPMSQFGSGLRNTLLFLPTTYGTALMKNSVMSSALRELEKLIPKEAINSIKESIDIRLIFNEHVVNTSTMYLIVIVTITVLFLMYILKNILCKNK
jgi:multidrug/hemolysin transport system permease protein